MFIAIGVAYGVFAFVVMLVEPPRKTSDPVALLAFAFAAIGTGALLLGARDHLPMVLALFGGNMAVIFGMAYQYWGITVASGRPITRPWRIVALTLLLIAGVVIYSMPAPWTYIALNLLYAGLFAASALAATRWRQTVLPLRVVLGTGFGLICVLYFERAWEFWSGRISGPAFSENNQSLSGLMLGALLYTMSLITGFGILMMRKRTAEQQLAAALRDQGTIIETLSTGIVIARNRTIISVNAAMEEMIGCAPGGLNGKSVRVLYPSNREFDLVGGKFYQAVVDTGHYAGEVQFVRRNGERFWVQMQVSALEDSSDPVTVVASITDISELKRMRDEFERQASLDELTGLPNRRSFLNSAGQLLAAAHRSHQPMVLAVIDLDKFKETNDRHGHAAGDAALVQVTEAFHETFRDMDVVARVGGDEFAVVLPDSDLAAGQHALARFADVLRSKPLALGDRLYRIAASIGIVQARPGETLDEVIAGADLQMYASKRRGGGMSSSREEQESSHAEGI